MHTKVIEIDPRQLKLLEVNAHYMPHETFQRLVANVKRDGELTQLPFAAPYKYYYPENELPKDETGAIIYEVLSGNHRVMAAIEAGLMTIKVQVTDDPLSPNQRKGLQLSHNAIFGQDDPTLLAEIYQSIDDLEFRLYSGLDDKILKLMGDDPADILSEANLTFQLITMMFLPNEIEEVNTIWDKAKKQLAGSRGAWLDRWANYDQAMETMETVSLAYGVRNTATAFGLMLKLVDRHVTELQEGFLESTGEAMKGAGQVPLEIITGSRTLPAKTAAKFKKALDKGRSEGQIKDGKWWLLLDKWLETL